jgi:peptidoglycan hydrolase-like protein with peptidoglycan-binding domain
MNPPSVPGDSLPPPPPSGIPPYPGHLIRNGSRGADVVAIQSCLNSIRSRFPSIGQLNPDGIFGSLTENSVREFQRIFGLNPDGVVGPLTWVALMPECHGGGTNPPPTTIPPYPGFLIRVGARGDYVRQIQTCLNATNGAGLNPDGVFGPLTQTAVMNYQRANGLNPDGIVGPITWEHLMRRCGGASRMSAATQDMTVATLASAPVAPVSAIPTENYTPPTPRMIPLAPQAPPPVQEEIPSLVNAPIVAPELRPNTHGEIQFAPGGAPAGVTMPYVPGDVEPTPRAMSMQASIPTFHHESFHPPMYHPPAYHPPVYQPPIYQPPIHHPQYDAHDIDLMCMLIQKICRR